MSVQQINGDPISSTSTNNSGGAGIRLGNSNKMSSISSANKTIYGGVAITSDVTPVLSEGIFANNIFHPIAKKVTSSIAGVNNDFLVSGASRLDLINNIDLLETRTTTKVASAIRSNKYDFSTGSFDAGFPEISNDNFGEDFAARMTNSYRGAITFNIGNPKAAQIAYYAPSSPSVEPQPQPETFRLLTENNLTITTESDQPLSIEG